MYIAPILEVKAAQHSVLLCAFDPIDEKMLDGFWMEIRT